MIWLRRSAAVFLAILAVLMLISALLIQRVNDTAENPTFYIEQLRKADVYNFVYDKALPAALTEQSDVPGLVSEFEPQIVNIIRQTLPPDWLQTQVENSIRQVVPYVVGDTESFQVNIPVKDRVQAAAKAAKDTLNDPAISSRLYDQTVTLIVDQGVTNMKSAPAAFALSRTELDTLVRAVVTKDWLVIQLNSAIDQLTPYLTKDNDTFTIKVNISDRMDALQAAVVVILKRQQTYDYVYQSVLVPAIKKNLGSSVSLVAGLSLSDADILQTVKQALPMDWYQARITDIVTQSFAYLKGQRADLNIALPLSDRKAAITQAVVNLVDQKLKALNLSAAALGINLNTLLAPMVNTWIPDQLTFTDTDLRAALGNVGNDGDIIARAKGWVQNGVTFTQVDLQNSLGINNNSLQDFRNAAATGVKFNQVDLRNQIAGESRTGEELREFDTVRSALKSLRNGVIWLWIFGLLILVGVGFLGGRRWGSRLIWGAAPLAIAGLLALIVSGPIFASTAQGKINEAISRATQGEPGLESILSQKAAEIAHNAVNSFVGGLVVGSIVMLVAGLILVGVGVFLYMQSRREPPVQQGQSGT